MTRAWRALERHATPRAILLGAWCVLVLYAYPGYLTSEGADQMMDSRTHQFTDWHSPAMTWIWSVIARAVAGPVPMLLLQSGLFLAGVYGVLRTALAARRAAIAAACVLLAPPVLAVMGVIWRESLMAGLLIAGAMWVRAAGPWRQLLGLACLGTACAVRETGALAALPLVIGLYAWRPDVRGWRRYAVATCAALALAFLGQIADRGLVDTQTHRPALELAAVDLVGTLAHASADDVRRVQVAVRDVGLPIVTAEDPRPLAVRAYNAPWSAMAGPARVFDAPTDNAGRARMLAAHRAVISEAFGAYASHRLRQFQRVLGLSKPLPAVYTKFTQSTDQARAASQRAHHSVVQRALIATVKATPRFVFLPVLYLALAIALLVLAVVQRHRMAIALLASGILFELGWMFAAAGAEYRYSHWLIASAIVSAILVVTAWRRGAQLEATGASDSAAVA